MIVLLLGLLVGVFIGVVWQQAGLYVLIFLIVVSALFVRKYVLLTGLILCLLGGYFWWSYSIHTFQEHRKIIGDMVGWDVQTHNIRGEVLWLLNTSEFAHKYRVSISSIDEKNIESFDAALSIPPNLSLLPGDTVTAVGRFSFPRDTADFFAEKQLWYRWILAEFRTFQSDKIVPEKYNYFVHTRLWFDRKLQTLFPAEWYTILSGILLGKKTHIEEDLKLALQKSWLMHIMVVSGSNVMMLIIFLSLFIRWLPVFLRIFVVTATIISFAILVGWDAPVWRAALMGIIGYSAGLWSYRFSPLILPLLVGVILALFNPLSLVYDIGLQLSFLSVISIIAFGKRLTRAFSFLWKFFDEAFSLTIAATIGTLPITLFYFGTFSLAWPLANLLAAPAIPLLMYGGIFTLFLSTFSETLAYFSGYLPWMVVTYLLQIITFFWGLSWSSFAFDISAYRTEFMFLVIGLFVLFVWKSVSTQKDPQ